MKRILKMTGVFFLSVLALFFIIPLFMETEYAVSRSIEISADQKTIYTYMGDFNTFNQWSPWGDKDPNMKVEITGNPGEIGSKYSWKGNDDVGEGSMEIVGLSENQIDIDLRFIAPFEAQSPTWYTFSEKNGNTTVTWSMEGEMPYPWNIFGLFMSMEDALGKDFDKGLNRLKSEIDSL
jgi:hypothetical protein